MTARDYLVDHSQKTKQYLDRFFLKEQKQAAAISPAAAEMIKIYHHFMGGKGIRGALTKLGYECFGGRDKKAILKASLMVEITHAFILMHDDVMDKDLLRRGQPTIHTQYETLCKKRFRSNGAKHYGFCMAINMGDAGFSMSHLILADSNFTDEVKTKVLRRFNEQILTTVFGQELDISYEKRGHLTEKDILQLHHFKTANYTITGPLQYGALFANAAEKEIKKIEKYGLPVGIAFQLRDDELGLFSSESQLGKPIGSDVKENKNTILKIKALEKANKNDRAFLKHAYGNRSLTQKELDRVRQITIDTGAFDYSQTLGRKLVTDGKRFISRVTADSERQAMLSKMADFMIERDK